MSMLITIVIGFAAVYAAFSLIASWAQEMIATALSLRSRNLIKGIENMLDDPAKAPVVEQLKSNLLQQPSIAATVTRMGTMPSYLSARQFSLAVTGAIRTAPTIATSAAAAAAQMVLDINSLPASRFKDALTQIAQQASGDYSAMIAGIEKWYDDEMDRVSGWYRRNAQILLFPIALILAVGFNLDAVRLLQGFEQSPLAIAPEKITDTRAAENYVLSAALQYPCIGWTTSNPSASTTPIPAGNAARVPSQTGAPAGKSALKPAPKMVKSPAPVAVASKTCGSIKESIALRTFGLFISAIALMLGAPFWFNVLGRFVNVRATGDKPAKSESTST
jgi:PBP1b-binding outer membrane lipoprotein LpoB